VSLKRRSPVRVETHRTPGNYKAEQFDQHLNAYTVNPSLQIFIFVDEVFDNDHRVVSQRGASSGKFTFIAHDAGDHKICFQPSHATIGGWTVGGQTLGNVKLTLDLAVGESSKIESTDKGKIQSIVQKVKDLNARLQDIRREQVFQRVRADQRSISVMPSTDKGYRSGRRSSEINPRLRMREWCGGLWSSL
jgi:hypothetical protein